jgi:hypothetical protein
MTEFLLALYCLLILFCGALLVRALRTGTVGFGSAAIHRAEDPARYRFEFVMVVLFALTGAWLIWQEAKSSDGDTLDSGNPFLLLIAAQIAFWLVRTLHSGSASLSDDLTFSRAEEPFQFWPLVAIAAAAIILVAWLSLPFGWT